MRTVRRRSGFRQVADSGGNIWQEQPKRPNIPQENIKGVHQQAIGSG
jgi:hypothetical protein